MRSIIIGAIAAGSLLLAVNAATAVSPANPIPQHARPNAPAAERVASPRLTPNKQLDRDVAQFIRGMPGGGRIPYANLVRDLRGMRGTGSFGVPDYSPTYDTSVPDLGAAAGQSAADAESQAIQSMNDTNAQTASMAAAEAQNDEANAATLQTEINAGM